MHINAPRDCGAFVECNANFSAARVKLTSPLFFSLVLSFPFCYLFAGLFLRVRLLHERVARRFRRLRSTYERRIVEALPRQ